MSESCRKASSLYKTDRQTTTAPPLSADLIIMSCRLLRCYGVALSSWIVARIEFTKTTGQILESSERHCRICLSRSSRFRHMALMVILINSIRAKIQELNATLFNHLNQIKTLTLEHLIGPKISSHATFDSQNTVVTIPENLPLTDSENSVLSKGLNFVPIAKRTDEFSVKQEVEKFLRRIQLKAFFHDKEDNSNASDKDIFETLHVRKSKWTPPEGQFSSLDFFIKKCRHDIQKLKFNCDTKFSNLSSEEWVALKNLSKRQFMDLLSRRANARNVSFSISVRWSIYIINSVDKPSFRVSLPHRRSTTVSLETNPL